jgi:Mob1/phocein family
LQYEYLWADGVKVKKPVKLTAPQYIEALFDWIDEQVCRATCMLTAIAASRKPLLKAADCL